MEPFYIRQTAEPMDSAERREWFTQCGWEAQRLGAKLCRYSVSDDGRLSLVEAWPAVAADVGYQGPPRFSYSAT